MNTAHLHDLPPDWQPSAAVFAALGDPLRQKILLLFEAGEELSIKEIAGLFPLSRTAVVHHLDVLQRAGILISRREGKAALYSARPEVVLEALENLRAYIADIFPGAETSHDRP